MPDIQAVLAANEKLSQEVLGASGDSIDQSRRFPRENLQALGKSGVLGLLIPAQYGGTGAGLAEMSHDTLVVFAGGGISVPQIRTGSRLVAELQREMDRTRRERLQSLGFEPAVATAMSAYHTKNFM